MTSAGTLLEKADGLSNSDPAEAVDAYRAVLAAEPDGLTEIRTRYGLGVALFRLGRSADARDELRAGAERCEALPGIPPLLYGRMLTLYGRACIAVDDFTAGMLPSERAVDILRGVTAAAGTTEERRNAGNALALACFFLSSAEYQQGRLDRAEELTGEAMGQWERSNGRRSTDVATCLNNLGRIAEERGDLARGIELHREAAGIYEELLGEHPQTAFSLGNLGTAMANAGMFMEAVDCLRRTLDIYARLGRTEGPDIDGYRHNLDVCGRALSEGQE